MNRQAPQNILFPRGSCMTGNGVKLQKTPEQIENELREEIRDAQLEFRTAPSGAARNRLREALHVFNNWIIQNEPWEIQK